MGGEGFEPSAPWSQTKIHAVENTLQYHTKLDHPPFEKRASLIKDLIKVFSYFKDKLKI